MLVFLTKNNGQTLCKSIGDSDSDDNTGAHFGTGTCTATVRLNSGMLVRG